MPIPAQVPLLRDQEQPAIQEQDPDQEQKAAEKNVNAVSTVLLFSGGIYYTYNKLYVSTAGMLGCLEGRDNAIFGLEAKYPPTSPFTYLAQGGLAIITALGIPCVQRYTNQMAFRGYKIFAFFGTLFNLTMQNLVIGSLFDEFTREINYSSAFYNLIFKTKCPSVNPLSHALVEEPRIEVIDAVCTTITAVSFIVAVGAGITFFNNRRARQRALEEVIVAAPAAPSPRLGLSNENNE